MQHEPTKQNTNTNRCGKAIRIGVVFERIDVANKVYGDFPVATFCWKILLSFINRLNFQGGNLRLKTITKSVRNWKDLQLDDVIELVYGHRGIDETSPILCGVDELVLFKNTRVNSDSDGALAISHHIGKVNDIRRKPLAVFPISTFSKNQMLETTTDRLADSIFLSPLTRIEMHQQLSGKGKIAQRWKAILKANHNHQTGIQLDVRKLSQVTTWDSSKSKDTPYNAPSSAAKRIKLQRNNDNSNSNSNSNENENVKTIHHEEKDAKTNQMDDNWDTTAVSVFAFDFAR